VTVIEISDLSYSYPGSSRMALRDIDLVLEEGELVMLTGPSGCGKTTLCRCLNGLIPHFYGGEFSGEVVVSGLSVREKPISSLSQHVGYVFQNPDNQLFALSVERDIAFGLENLAMPRDEIRRRVDWAMEIVGVSALRHLPPHELSGGEKQKVAIACILAMQPEVVIMDEPTSNLDPVAARRMFDLIKDLNHELGLTVILVEHRLDLISTYVNRVVVMDGGRIRMDGSPRDVLDSVEARLLGLGIPKITRLYQELREEGLDFEDVPLTVAEFSSAFRGLVAK